MADICFLKTDTNPIIRAGKEEKMNFTFTLGRFKLTYDFVIYWANNGNITPENQSYSTASFYGVHYITILV